jgi:GTP-binding protein
VSSFVDEAQIHVKAGNGGAGCVSFRREAHVAKGGPDGGDGGSGGDVVLIADRNVSSLLSFRDHPHRGAEDGTHGSGKKKHGKSGADLLVAVPEGTIVRARNGEVLAELISEGDQWISAYGGRGGRGNARFLSNARRAPTFAEQGEVGEEHYYNLELKLFADVALVGFPNAGKSTLISRISAAKPKVADYPFTTLEPHLGVVRFDEHEFVVADIPGLIEGASEGRGLGQKFLRHIERARALCILVDLASDERSPDEQEKILLSELENYDSGLLDRPQLIVGSRADVALDQNKTWRGLRISAVTGENIAQFLGELANSVEKVRAEAPIAPTYVLHRPTEDGVHISKEDDGSYVVSGKAALRAVALSDLTDVQAQAYLRRRLDRLGVEKSLKKAGIKDGDTVHIGDFSFEYQDDEVAGDVEVS